MIYLFYGEETYQSSQEVVRLKNDFLTKNPTASDPIVFDCNEICNIDEIMWSLGKQSLFAQNKMIIIEDFFAHTNTTQHKQLLEKVKDGVSDTLVFFEKGKIRKNVAFFVWLKENTQSKEFIFLDGVSLEKWVLENVHTQEANIDIDAVKKLIIFVGDDLWRLSHEIDKVVCYAYGRCITVQDVEDIVCKRIDANIFEMIDAIASHDKQKALYLLKKQIAAGDNLFQIFGMYVYHVRILLLVSGVIREGIVNKNDIAKKIKINPFVAQKALWTLQKISYEDVMRMHKKLTIFDRDIKTGKRDIVTALDLFVISV